MPSSTLPNLTNLATPQPTMLLYAALSPFGATDDRKITANALFATITQNISDVSLQFDDGLASSTVSAAGKGKLRYNDTTKTFQFSADGAAYADLGGGTSKWNGITNPDGNFALTMAAFTSTFTYNAATGANSLYVLTTGNDDTGTTYLFSLLTPGGSNTKKPFGVTARGSVVLEVLAVGNVSIPGTGSDSTRIGSGSISSGLQATQVGVNSTVSGDLSVGVGSFLTVSASGSMGIGSGAASITGSGRSQGIGQGFAISGFESAGIGTSITVSGSQSFAWGAFASVTHDQVILLGRAGASTASNQAIFGSSGTQIDNVYIGRGVVEASPASTVTINATGGSGTDIAGSALRIAGGKGTGNAVPGRVHIQSSVFGSTGTTLQSLVDRAIYGAAKILANNTTTTAVNITVANDTVASGIVDYAVEVFDGASVQLESGSFLYQVTNDGGAIANNTITFPTGYPVNVTTSGTLTVTWTITAANPALLRVNANSSLTPSTGYPRVTYTLRNLTSQAVAVQ